MSLYLSIVVHGESKTGKTWFASSAPKPILVIDAEAGGMRFVPGKKISWDPLSEPPPKDTGWDLCNVHAKDSKVVQALVGWLRTGDICFKSIVFDSLTEFQRRFEREIAPDLTGKVTYHHYRTMLRVLEDMIIQIRDIALESGLECSVIITGTDNTTGIYRPLLTGKLARLLPYKVDIFGYIGIAADEEGKKVRWLQIEPDAVVSAGNRVGGLLPSHIPNPNLTDMIETIKKGIE